MQARITWESRQRLWYDMRHNGLRRKSVPWPGAADLHYPLADSIINKLKPFYFQQIFASELLAQFTPWTGNPDKMDAMSAQLWFDYKLRQDSNLETEVLHLIDAMLMSGIGVMKCNVDVDKKRLNFEAIEPLYIIVPRWTPKFEDLGRVVHVMRLPYETYMANPNYKKDKEFVESIKGMGSNTEQGQQRNYEIGKQLREGTTMSAVPDNEIIVMEVYEKDEDKWRVHTFSPWEPETDIRKTFRVLYKDADGKDILPFVPFVTEIKDKGFYSPRGIPELSAPFEASLCKLWNEKHDCMTVYNRPVFRSSEEMPNTVNLQFKPGSILPYGIEPIPTIAPPVSFDQEMIATRQVAEQLIGMPDLGMGSEQQPDEARTAKEIEAVSGLMGQVVDMRARIFRLNLGKLYQMCWSMYMEIDSPDLKFWFQEQQLEISPQTLQTIYRIKPSGSADGVNKPLLFQKRLQMAQIMATNPLMAPFVNGYALAKGIVELDDPASISTMLRNPNVQLQDQSEDAALENLLMDKGFPVQVKQSNDDAAHLQTHLGDVEADHLQGKPFNPQKARVVQPHIAQHLQNLQQKNPEQAAMFKKQILGMEKGDGQPVHQMPPIGSQQPQLTPAQ